MKTLIVETTHLPGIDHGWGNGYVVIPEGHKLHGLSYVQIHEAVDIEVHYGLTFSELVTDDLLPYFDELTTDDIGAWMVGFDTAHYRDDINKWPKYAVQNETDFLRDQLSAVV